MHKIDNIIWDIQSWAILIYLFKGIWRVSADLLHRTFCGWKVSRLLKLKHFFILVCLLRNRIYAAGIHSCSLGSHKDREGSLIKIRAAWIEADSILGGNTFYSMTSRNPVVWNMLWHNFCVNWNNCNYNLGENYDMIRGILPFEGLLWFHFMNIYQYFIIDNILHNMPKPHKIEIGY